MNTKQHSKEATLTLRKGMEGFGDFEFDYLTEEEIEQKRKERYEYIERCKQDGTYGDEYTLKISVQRDRNLDYIDNKSVHGADDSRSFSFILTDWSKIDDK